MGLRTIEYTVTDGKINPDIHIETTQELFDGSGASLGFGLPHRAVVPATGAIDFTRDPVMNNSLNAEEKSLIGRVRGVDIGDVYKAP